MFHHFSAVFYKIKLFWTYSEPDLLSFRDVFDDVSSAGFVNKVNAIFKNYIDIQKVDWSLRYIKNKVRVFGEVFGKITKTPHILFVVCPYERYIVDKLSDQGYLLAWYLLSLC